MPVLDFQNILQRHWQGHLFTLAYQFKKLPSIEEPLAKALKVNPERLNLQQKMKPVRLKVSSPTQGKSNGTKYDNLMIGYQSWNKCGDIVVLLQAEHRFKGQR